MQRCRTTYSLGEKVRPGRVPARRAHDAVVRGKRDVQLPREDRRAHDGAVGEVLKRLLAAHDAVRHGIYFFFSFSFHRCGQWEGTRGRGGRRTMLKRLHQDIDGLRGLESAARARMRVI